MELKCFSSNCCIPLLPQLLRAQSSANESTLTPPPHLHNQPCFCLVQQSFNPLSFVFFSSSSQTPSCTHFNYIELAATPLAWKGERERERKKSDLAGDGLIKQHSSPKSKLNEILFKVQHVSRY